MCKIQIGKQVEQKIRSQICPRLLYIWTQLGDRARNQAWSQVEDVIQAQVGPVAYVVYGQLQDQTLPGGKT